MAVNAESKQVRPKLVTSVAVGASLAQADFRGHFVSPPAPPPYAKMSVMRNGFWVLVAAATGITSFGMVWYQSICFRKESLRVTQRLYKNYTAVGNRWTKYYLWLRGSHNGNKEQAVTRFQAVAAAPAQADKAEQELIMDVDAARRQGKVYFTAVMDAYRAGLLPAAAQPWFKEKALMFLEDMKQLDLAVQQKGGREHFWNDLEAFAKEGPRSTSCWRWGC
jgi:hypothetical protein